MFCNTLYLNGGLLAIFLDRIKEKRAAHALPASFSLAGGRCGKSPAFSLLSGRGAHSHGLHRFEVHGVRRLLAVCGEGEDVDGK